jgi:hypothetical protein
MSSTEFALAMEAELRLMGVPFDLGELPARAADVWPLAEEGDAGRWARQFLDATTAGPDRRRASGRPGTTGQANFWTPRCS